MEKNDSWTRAKTAEVALKAGEKKLAELTNQLPATQKKIDESQLYLDLKRADNADRQTFLARMMQKVQELRLSQEKLQRASSQVTKKRGLVEQDTRNAKRLSQNFKDQVKRFELDVSDILQQMLKDTQGELNQRLLEIQEHDYKKRIAEEDYKRLKDEESLLFSGLEGLIQPKAPAKNEVVACGIQSRQVKPYMHGIQPQQTPMHIRSAEECSGGMEKGDVTMEEVEEGRVTMANIPRLACDRVQTPPPGPFNSNVLKWFSEEAYVPISRVKDFIEGEEKREDFECKFTIRKTEDRFFSNGKKLIRYWCSYGPVDLRRDAMPSMSAGSTPEMGEGSRPSRSQRKKLGFSSARGCRCHFAVIYRRDRPEACLIRWLNREHHDKDGNVCHGRLDASAPGADDRPRDSNNSDGV